MECEIIRHYFGRKLINNMYAFVWSWIGSTVCHYYSYGMNAFDAFFLEMEMDIGQLYWLISTGKSLSVFFFLISLTHSRFLFLGKVMNGIGDKFQSDSICMHIKHSNDSHSGHWIRYIRSMHTYLEWMATIAHSYTIWNCTSLASSYTQLMYSVELWNLFIVLYALGKEFETNICAPLAAKQYALHLYAARVHDVNFH